MLLRFCLIFCQFQHPIGNCCLSKSVLLVGISKNLIFFDYKTLLKVVYQWFSCFCFLIYFPKLYRCSLWSIKIYLQCCKTFRQVWYSIAFRNILEPSMLYWFPVLWRENALLSYRLKTRTFWWCQSRNPPSWKKCCTILFLLSQPTYMPSDMSNDYVVQI